ncbi:hypothetical protein GCM10025768_16350 [Microbacterium pseudoresistens]|uniref:General stress protein 17M-like domain-containing protein n=1 Tax=Microbacterium pseudoresistens TaxID=640634 RepID=A0A7Y9ESB3_9MICO|nr:general stress protein [Microbacterium pseudoresistens]NYD53013.1 hypothetical protein [Microbacterium pseudoresistens]
MSLMNRPAGADEIGETIASMREYEAAQKLVSTLITAEIPAREIAIVGIGVRTIERVTGRLGYAAAARSGAINGVLIGLLLAAFFVFGNPAAPIQTFVGVLFVGVAVGMIMSLVTYAIVRRRRDYASVTQLSADHYEVTVMPSSLSKARQALGRTAPPPAARPVPADDEPPRYGERLPAGSTQAAGAPTQARTDGATAQARTDGATAPAAASSDTEPPRYGERVPAAPPPPPTIPAAEAAATAPAADVSEEPAREEPATGKPSADGGTADAPSSGDASTGDASSGADGPHADGESSSRA